MIYISINNHQEITTDNITNYIPDILTVYLDDTLIGEFTNLSTKLIYLTFQLPALDLQEKEYIMKIYNHNALIKEEVVIVKDFLNPTYKVVTNSKSIKFYE